MLIFASCDPALLLTVKVDNKNTQSIILFTDKRILPFNHDNDSSKFIIQVPYNDSIIKTFNYGIGAWSNESIIELTKIIDSIYINDGKNTKILIKKSDMENYLRKNRSGYAGSILTIKAQ